MSENFDKEAEREKLRKKYEQDKQKREQTEQMSELLLKGATMTNAHCSDCGDPIFRYDGQEFCPTCEKPVDRGDGAAQGEAGEEGAESGEDQQIEVTSPTDDARVSFGAAAESDEGDDPSTPDAPASTEPTPSEQRETAQGRASPEAPAERQRRAGAGEAAASGEQGASATEIPGVDPGAGGIDAARQSLVRTLTHFSERAEQEADPREAEAALAAAREAAEALAALRR